MAEARKKMWEYETERIAWQTANLMNIHLRRNVTVKELLGKTKKKMTTIERKQNLKKLKKALEERRERSSG